MSFLFPAITKISCLGHTHTHCIITLRGDFLLWWQRTVLCVTCFEVTETFPPPHYSWDGNREHVSLYRRRHRGSHKVSSLSWNRRQWEWSRTSCLFYLHSVWVWFAVKWVSALSLFVPLLLMSLKSNLFRSQWCFWRVQVLGVRLTCEHRWWSDELKRSHYKGDHVCTSKAVCLWNLCFMTAVQYKCFTVTFYILNSMKLFHLASKCVNQSIKMCKSKQFM